MLAVRPIFFFMNSPTDSTGLGKALADMVPLSKLMAEQIAGLRKWAVGRCRMATSPAKEGKGRKIAA